jgi:4-carboxymuconolactone decarboxylase
MVPGPDDQPRVAPLAPSERTERQAALVARAGGELAVFTTLVRNADVFADFLTFGERLLNGSTLRTGVREQLILRVAWRCRAQYIWAHHEVIGRSAGLTDDDLDALTRDTVAPDDPDRSLPLRVADELVTAHRLSAPTWDDLTARYPTEQIIEICMLVGVYALLSGTVNSLGIQLESPVPPGDAPPPHPGPAGT